MVSGLIIDKVSGLEVFCENIEIFGETDIRGYDHDKIKICLPRSQVEIITGSYNEVKKYLKINNPKK